MKVKRVVTHVGTRSRSTMPMKRSNVCVPPAFPSNTGLPTNRGACRFYVCDPSGKLVNVLAHC